VFWTHLDLLCVFMAMCLQENVARPSHVVHLTGTHVVRGRTIGVIFFFLKLCRLCWFSHEIHVFGVN